MAITEIYVDPAINADSGTGSSGDPFGDLQYALDNTTRDATNGNRFNIKAGAAEVMAAAINLTTYGTPGFTAPLIFQGYTSAAGDGGIGDISGGGSVGILNSTALDFISFIDLHLHNCGAATIVAGDDNITIVNCELDTTTGDGVNVDVYLCMLGCNVHDIGNQGVIYESGVIKFNRFGNGAFANGCVNKVSTSQDENFIERNIFTLTSASTAINCNAANSERISISHNSMFTTSTGTAILFDAGASGASFDIVNNLLEGWTVGIALGTSTEGMTYIGSNSFFNCGSTITGGGKITLQSSNETLGATPFAKSGADTYANRATYFAPVNTGAVLTPLGGMGGARGAAQLTSASAGALLRPVGLSGGLV